MKTLNDYQREYVQAIAEARNGDELPVYVVKFNIWIYCKWSSDCGFEDAEAAHNAINSIEEEELRDYLISGEKLFLRGIKK